MKKTDLIQQTTEELFAMMNFEDAVVEIEEKSDPETLVVNVRVDDAGQLIGQGGINLNDLQKILRLLVAKKDLAAPNFLLDINGYRKKREEFLKELGKEIAGQVVKNKEPVMLQPMSSYERRIIHLEIADNPDVETESVGEGSERRIIIKPRA